MSIITREIIKQKINLKLEKNNSPKDILFFTGAGIAAPVPCSFPLGIELYELLLHYFTDMEKPEIHAYIEDNSYTFEETVSIIMEEFGPLDHSSIPFNLLSDIFIFRYDDEYKKINDYHKFFRAHVDNGGKHFTVNLDQFIELAEKAQINILTAKDFDKGPTNNIYDYSGFLLKIHGDPNIDGVGLQGFLHQVIKTGLSEKVKSFFDRHLNKAKTVIFIGYGGIDKFDVTPYFQSKSDHFFQNTSALWINYSTEQEVSEISDVAESQKIILSKFGSSLSVKCSPEVILNRLFSEISEIFSVKNNGYKKEYEDIFRCNTSDKAFKGVGITNANQIKKRIKEKLLK